MPTQSFILDPLGLKENQSLPENELRVRQAAIVMLCGSDGTI